LLLLLNQQIRFYTAIIIYGHVRYVQRNRTEIFSYFSEYLQFLGYCLALGLSMFNIQSSLAGHIMLLTVSVKSPISL